MARIHAVVTVFASPTMLHHFCDHYARLGVDRILVGLNVDYDMSHLQRRYPQVSVVQTSHHRFGERRRIDEEERILDAHDVSDDDWIMHLDLDEFHQYPAHVRDVCAQAESKGISAVFGRLIDRVATGGVLSSLESDLPIQEQYPLAAELTGPLTKGRVRKVMLAKRYVQVGGGHHDTVPSSQPICPLGKPDDYLVHHFRWTADLVKRLKERWTNDELEKDGWGRNNMAFVSEYRKHGRIDLSSPRFNVRPATRFVFPPASTVRHTRTTQGSVAMNHNGTQPVVTRPSLDQTPSRRLRPVIRVNQAPAGRDGTRVLLYGLQSSGASTMACLLGQREDAIVAIDVQESKAAPGQAVFPPHSAVKITIPPQGALEYLKSWRRVVRPDRTLLVVRNPWCNYASLKAKSYGDMLDDKLAALERLWVRRAELFDGILVYEDLAYDHNRLARTLGFWGLPSDFIRFPITVPQIVKRARASVGWIGQSFNRSWGVGNIHSAQGRCSIDIRLMSKAIDEDDYDKVVRISPHLCSWYSSQDKRYVDVAVRTSGVVPS